MITFQRCEEGNRHARKHFEDTGHPVMKPHLEPKARWMWCYADQALLDLPAAMRTT